MTGMASTGLRTLCFAYTGGLASWAQGVAGSIQEAHAGYAPRCLHTFNLSARSYAEVSAAIVIPSVIHLPLCDAAAAADFPENDPSRPANFFSEPHEEDLTALCIVGIKVGGPASVCMCANAISGITGAAVPLPSSC